MEMLKLLRGVGHLCKSWVRLAGPLRSKPLRLSHSERHSNLPTHVRHRSDADLLRSSVDGNANTLIDELLLLLGCLWLRLLPLHLLARLRNRLLHANRADGTHSGCVGLLLLLSHHLLPLLLLLLLQHLLSELRFFLKLLDVGGPLLGVQALQHLPLLVRQGYRGG